jgi:hypothetical protein
MPATGAVEAAGRDQAQHEGDLDLGVGLARLQVGNAEGGQAGRGGLGLPHGLQRRELHFLVVGQGVAALVAQHDHRQRRGQAEGGRHGQRALGDADMAALQQVEGADPSTKTAAMV